MPLCCEKESVRQLRFLTLNGTSYSFEMQNWLNKELVLDRTLKSICEKISKACEDQPLLWEKFPDKRCCVFLITRTDELYQLLDEQGISEKAYCFLIFEKDNDESIKIIHFGPIGQKQCGTFTEQLEKADEELSILKEILDKLGPPESPHEDIILAQQGKSGIDVIAKLIAEHREPLQSVEIQTEFKKQELINLTEQVYTDAQAREKARILIGKINMSASTGKIFLKSITAILFAELAEELAKKFGISTATKAATKIGAGKIAKTGSGLWVAKAMPFVGLGVGAAFGAWRVWQGDLTGAGMEVASGAAACVPGSGTTASLVIDALIVAKDISEAKDPDTENLKRLDAEIKKIELELNNLSDRYEQALDKYNLVKDMLEHEEFSVENLVKECQTRSQILAAIRRPLVTLQGLPVTVMDNSGPNEFEDSTQLDNMCFVIV